ncbi:hypothetical protein QO179_24800 [Bacillus stercoris]|nr:hypothetical protein [Bacillus stercoris]
MNVELVEKYAKMMSFDGKPAKETRVNVSEALTTADANILIPKVISQVVTEAAEPLYLASQFFQKFNLMKDAQWNSSISALSVLLKSEKAKSIQTNNLT